ncbi:MAG: LysR family transcriptional regulator, partial [Polyangiales bacterium]
VSAPAMTKAIQKLEDELGVKLFERTTRRVTLTENGSAVLRRAREALAQVDEIATDLDALRDDVSGELRIGAMEVFSVRVLPRAVASLVREHPKVVPLAYEMHPESMQRHLVDGLLDVAFTIGAPTSKGIHTESIGESRGQIVCGRAHPLYKSGRITRAALLDFPFVVPRFFQREHLYSLDQFPEATYPRRVGATIELLQMMVELTMAGSYLGYFPELSIAHHLSSGALRALKGLRGLPTFGLYAWTRRGGATKRSARALIDAVLSSLSEAG